MTRPRLILASASPRRLDLLGRLGVTDADVRPAELDETPEAGEAAQALALRLAGAKAAAVAAPGSFVLAADTVVFAGRRLLPKAEDEASVRACLRLLSGRRHRVVTAVALVRPDGRSVARAVTSIVTFKRLEEPQLDWYAACGEGIGKAGGYAIQGRAEAFVRFLSGSHSNVVGLPLAETAQLLAGNGFPLFAGPCAAS